MKSLKTPLRYPGGKSRACVKMDPYFPDLREYTEFREPFIGGGSVAIHVTKKYHLKVWVNDLYEPLVNFWQQLQMFGPEMKDRLQELKSEHPDPDSAKRLFLESKEYLNDESIWTLYGVLLETFTLLISVLSVVLPSPRPSQNRQVTPTSQCEESKNFQDIQK